MSLLNRVDSHVLRSPSASIGKALATYGASPVVSACPHADGDCAVIRFSCCQRLHVFLGWGEKSFRTGQIDRPNEAIQWAANRGLKAAGIRSYDMGGGGGTKGNMGGARSGAWIRNSRYRILGTTSQLGPTCKETATTEKDWANHSDGVYGRAATARTITGCQKAVLQPFTRTVTAIGPPSDTTYPACAPAAGAESTRRHRPALQCVTITA